MICLCLCSFFGSHLALRPKRSGVDASALLGFFPVKLQRLGGSFDVDAVEELVDLGAVFGVCQHLNLLIVIHLGQCLGTAVFQHLFHDIRCRAFRAAVRAGEDRTDLVLSPVFLVFHLIVQGGKLGKKVHIRRCDRRQISTVLLIYKGTQLLRLVCPRSRLRQVEILLQLLKAGNALNRIVFALKGVLQKADTVAELFHVVGKNLICVFLIRFLLQRAQLRQHVLQPFIAFIRGFPVYLLDGLDQLPEFLWIILHFLPCIFGHGCVLLLPISVPLARTMYSGGRLLFCSIILSYPAKVPCQPQFICTER